MSDAESLAAWVQKWRNAEPGSRARTEAADMIEHLERLIFGNRSHALGCLLECGP